MGNHSMRLAKPRTVMTVGPIFLQNVFAKVKDARGKTVRILVRQYSGNPGANRRARREASAIFRREVGKQTFALIHAKAKEMPFDEAVKVTLDNVVNGRIVASGRSITKAIHARAKIDKAKRMKALATLDAA